LSLREVREAPCYNGAVLAISAFFSDSNYFECVFWCAIGVGFGLRAVLRSDHRPSVIVAGGTFVIFGLSDFVEAHTGAWWRPWWLLAWKGLCLLVFLILLVRYARERRAGINPDTAGPSHSNSDPAVYQDQNPHRTMTG
jgi:hypothetical protein